MNRIRIFTQRLSTLYKFDTFAVRGVEQFSIQTVDVFVNDEEL